MTQCALFQNGYRRGPGLRYQVWPVWPYNVSGLLARINFLDKQEDLTVTSIICDLWCHFQITVLNVKQLHCY